MGFIAGDKLKDLVSSLGKQEKERSVTETPSVSPRPLSGIHIPLLGAPVSAHGRAACHPSHACAFR